MDLHNIWVIAPSSIVKRRPSVIVDAINLRPVFEENLIVEEQSIRMT